ncbi:MAG: DNA-methyltransferase [Desulfatibacillaceae bacterium]
METTSKTHYQDASQMAFQPDESVHLVVTSPPYPMIEMWDDVFRFQSEKAVTAMERGDGAAAFEAMHEVLDGVWAELYRVLAPGCLACINIGDATRTVADDFSLYTNHARILSACLALGFTALPDILWRKQTNAPNKFMGSGMLPGGAYVTLEHEYVLVLRKGGKREFDTPEEKRLRRESAYFWEERNSWFSDIWFDIKGARQDLFGMPELRKRSGAYPFELAWRLVNMYSAKGDTVLDPFAGTGTTMAAALVGARNFVGCEVDPGMEDCVAGMVSRIPEFANQVVGQRLSRHREFIETRTRDKGPPKHFNENYGFGVVTRQEKDILFSELMEVIPKGPGEYLARYTEEPTPRII